MTQSAAYRDVNGRRNGAEHREQGHAGQSERRIRQHFGLVHVLFALLLGMTLCSALRGPVVQQTGLAAANPGGSSLSATHPGMFCAVIVLLELYLCVRLYRKGGDAAAKRSAADIGCILYTGLILWEFVTTVLHAGHPILCPPPEAVFDVFRTQRVLILRGIASSMELLATGFATALPLSLILGAFAGWNQRFAGMTVPVARVMAPVPAIIYAPYIIAIMPSFRSAAAMVIVLGIFWPSFLQTVNRVRAMDSTLVDSARMLSLSNTEMVFHVIVPWLVPGLIASLRVSLSTSFMLLILAEMMGATSGLGYFIKNFADYANYTNVLAGIIIVGIVVNILNCIPTLLERVVVRWR